MESLDEIRRERTAKYAASKMDESDARNRSRSPRRRQPEPTLSTESCMRVMTWNIDGLDSEHEIEDMLGRTLWVVKTINEERPHVVFLQELIDFNMRVLTQALGKAFHIFTQQDPSMPYFVAILVHKATVSVLGNPKPIPFPSSKMGREGLSIQVRLKSASPTNPPVECITAHLESLRESSRERVNQLSILDEHISDSFRSGTKRIVFGGDLNIRDSEVPSDWMSRDCWIQTGRNKEHEFTWDLMRNDNAQMPNGGKPRCRFDRMYSFSSPQESNISVESFSLVGTERVEGLDRFPSDHFGLVVSFHI